MSTEAMRVALADCLDFVERHSNRWDGINGKHPHEVVEAARTALAQRADEPVAFNKAYALALLTEASKSGDGGAISLAAQLAGASPCTVCGYVNFKCRCSATPAAPAYVPLNDMEISDAYVKWGRTHGSTFVDLCRVIESLVVARMKGTP
jgi:hypothetical protein